MNRIEYLLTKLQEEAGELVTAAAKCALFGKGGEDPSTGIYYDNVERLKQELIDVIGVADMLIDEGYMVDPLYYHEDLVKKKEKVNRYIGYHGTANNE